ncbi:SdrD B-like domain-containing protein [Lewinella sp. 4G2]|uniref:DUF7619 domain-containing protein n=1 Tax=Lewinella sp. 4G2 TaxID=1803372 RepID=UPI0007B4E885|nr:SdrD B-like domain-containing protein [Lewinella sp. 4G2]OAV44134.1 hypothetical protein A3850_006310 [Lewinella sp. 4G2]
MRFTLLLLALFSASLSAQNCTEGCGSISGISWLDENENGIRDVGEPGVATDVRLLEINTGNLYVIFTQDGNYTYPNLAAGNYLVEFGPQDQNLSLTLSQQGDDPTVDSDPLPGSVAVEIQLGEGEDVTSAADIGWVTGIGCDLTFQETRSPSCDNPSADLEIITRGLGQATLTLNGVVIGETINDTFLINNVEPGFNDLTAVFADGCQTFITFNVSAPDPFLGIEQIGSFCTDPGAVTLQAVHDDASPVLGYLWSDGSTLPFLVGVEYQQEYSVTVSFANGCVASASYQVLPTEVVFPDTVRLLDCTILTDTFRLPVEFVPGIRFQLLEGLNDPVTITEFVFDTTTTYFVEPVEEEACWVEGFGIIEDGRLDNLVFEQRRPDDCLLEEATVFVFNPESSLTSPDITFNFFGPAEIRVNANERSFAELLEANVGTYSVEVSTTCGDTTMFLDVTIPDTCDFAPNVSGFVRLNDDGTCNASPNLSGVGIPGINVRLSNGPREYYFVTDSAGKWEGLVLAGDYAVTTFAPLDSSLVGCGTRAIGTDDDGDPPMLISPMIEVQNCASLNVEIVSSRFRRCFENSAYVNYANRGSRSAQNTELKVTVDPLFEEVTATADFTREGDTLTFNLSDINAFGNGQIRIDFIVSCESDFGQLHCIEAQITADNACNPGDGIALIDVRGAGCETDSLFFDILNVGTEAMTEDLEYYVYVSGQLSQDYSQIVPGLAGGESLRLSFPATGETVQVIARQSAAAGATGAIFPSAIIESCGGVMTGNATKISSDNELLGRATYCRTNQGSFDPNEKLVFPTGLGEDNDVQPGTRLTYELHFQNTGTDTAFTVVIRDTLPLELDLETIEFGPASHDYTVMVDNGRALTFRFDDINLVDSFTNVPGSMGVVSFTIDHDTSLQRGDRFQNRAGIFFDFNEPIITEYARTRLAPLDLMVSADAHLATEVTALEIYPNPTADRLRITLTEAPTASGLEVIIQNAVGAEVARRPFQGTTTELSAANLPDGFYIATLAGAGRVYAMGKFVVKH